MHKPIASDKLLPAAGSSAGGGTGAAAGQPTTPGRQRDTAAGRRLARSKGKQAVSTAGDSGETAGSGNSTPVGEGLGEVDSSVEALLQRSGFITRIDDCCYGISQGELAELAVPLSWRWQLSTREISLSWQRQLGTACQCMVPADAGAVPACQRAQLPASQPPKPACTGV